MLLFRLLDSFSNLSCEVSVLAQVVELSDPRKAHRVDCEDNWNSDDVDDIDKDSDFPNSATTSHCFGPIGDRIENLVQRDVEWKYGLGFSNYLYCFSFIV